MSRRNSATILTLSFLSACNEPEETSEYKTDPTAPFDTGFTTPCEDDAQWTTSDVVSPSEGVVITDSPWVPVMVHFDGLDYLGGGIQSWLDCEPYGDGSGVFRPRTDILSGGSDFLGTLQVLDLSPGQHTLVHRFSDVSGEDVTWAGSTFTYDPPPNLITANVTDSSGAPLYARIVVLRDGTPYDVASPDGKNYDPKQRDTMLTSFFAVDGVGQIRLDKGNYRFMAVRSAFDTTQSKDVEVDGDVSVDFTLDRAVDTTNWSTADFHVHSGASPDSYLPDRPRIYSLAAAGIDVVVDADHDTVRNFDEALVTILGKDKTVFSIPGSEATILVEDPTDSGADTATLPTYTSYGHLSAFPLDPAAVTVNPFLETTLADYMSQFRTAMATTPFEKNTTGILQLNHPRGIQMRPDILPEPIHDLFNKLGYSTASPPGAGGNEWMTEVSSIDGKTTAFDFDALEIMNRGSWDLYNAVRRDWFGLLNWGVRITGTGNSDSHAMAIEVAGFPVNLAPCPVPKPGGAVDVGCWVDAVASGRIVVSNGPVVELFVTQNKKPHGIGDLFTRDKSPMHAQIRVRAAPWVVVPEVRLIVNGNTLETAKVLPEDREKDGSFQHVYNWNIPLQNRDTWVIAEAGWPLDQPYPKGQEELLGDYAVVVPGYLPLGFTNPVWVDEDGDGHWIPPPPPPPPQ